MTPKDDLRLFAKPSFLMSLNSSAAGIDQVCTFKHALAVAEETFKFSSRQGGVAYELS
jgi:hypothetical protein